MILVGMTGIELIMILIELVVLSYLEMNSQNFQIDVFYNQDKGILFLFHLYL